MRGRFSVFFVALWFGAILLFPLPASAADMIWSWEWKESGVIEESIELPAAIQVPEDGWKAVKSGERMTYTREAPDWDSYLKLPNHLPLLVNEDKSFLWTSLNIQAVPAPQDSLFKQLAEQYGMDLKLVVPGLIKEQCADQNNENNLVWQDLNENNNLPADKALLSTTIVDGLLLGISILAVGALILLLFFIARLRKVDKIIADVYSLENINLDDIEKEQGD